MSRGDDITIPWKVTKIGLIDHAANELINHSYIVETPVKYLDTKTQKGFLVGQDINVLGRLFI